MKTLANEEEYHNDEHKQEIGPMPKHIPFPDFVGTNSELINELIIFVFYATAAAMQFINIYRTEYFWLPDSHTNHVVNIYLIEPYLVVIIAIIVMRRLCYCLLLAGLRNCSKNRQLMLRAFVRYVFTAIFALTFCYCVWKVYVTHSYFALFLLFYPIIVYFLIFGLKIEPFLRTQCECQQGAYLNGLPMHSCSSSPTAIRLEIDTLRNDFNLRFRQIIFTSAINAYFAAFIPCFFAVSILYNKWFACMQIVFVWLTGLALVWSFLFPSKYGDILHRASLHLGYWAQLENNAGSGANLTANAVPYQASKLYPHGTIIRHNDEYFKSVGPLTVAMPGNASHSRFYRLFQNPSLIFKILSLLQCCIVLSEIFLLYFALEWHFILSLSFIALTNQFTLFKILRDYFLTKRIYTSENSIGDRLTNSLHMD